MSIHPDPHPHRAVHTRVADQFAPAYLTLASIIQGVALSSLVMRVEPNVADYSLADWVRATASLVAVLAIWHEYLMMVLAFAWLPTLIDSMVPFAFLVAEVFMVHFLPADQPRWLVAIGALFALGVTAWVVQVRQARMFSTENREIQAVLLRNGRSRSILATVLAILNFSAAALYDVLHLSQVELVVSIAALGAVSLFLASSTPAIRLMQSHVITSRAREELTRTLVAAPPTSDPGL